MISLKKAVLGTSIACAALIATTSFASTTAAQNIVTNGGFENGTTGFTITGAGGGTGINSGSGVGGSNAVEFAAVGATDTLSQNLATFAGSTYTLSYALSNLSGGSTTSFVAAVNGTTLSSFNNPPAFGFTTFTNTFTASSSSSLLSFTGRQDPSACLLDSVSVTETVGLRSLSSFTRPEYEQYQRDDFSRTSLNSRILSFRRDLEDN